MQSVVSWLGTNYLELLGFLTSLYCVWLSIRASLQTWVWSFVSSALSAALFYQVRLIGDMFLQFCFMVMAVYGFWQWKFRKSVSKDPLHITFLPKKLYTWVFLTTGIIWWITYQLLKYLRGDMALWDSLTTTLSLVATYLLARKYIENWLLWIVANLIYIGMYFYKEIYWYAVLYGIFEVMAWQGFSRWKKEALMC